MQYETKWGLFIGNEEERVRFEQEMLRREKPEHPTTAAPAVTEEKPQETKPEAIKPKAVAQKTAAPAKRGTARK